MGEDTEPSANGTIMPLSHGRILKLMAVIGLVGGILGIALVSLSFGAGVLVGSLLAFVNYYWLKHSLKKIFAAAAESGERPRLQALRYLGRYIVIGGIVAVLYATDAVSATGLILGIGSFGIAVIFDGLIKIFSGPPAAGEN